MNDQKQATILFRVEQRDGVWWAVRGVQADGAVDEHGPFATEAGAWAALGEMKALKRGQWVNHTVVYLFVLTQIVITVLGTDNFWGKLSLVTCFGAFIYVVTRE